MTFERNTKRSMSDQMYSQLSIRLGLTQNEMFLDSVAIKQSKFFFARLAFIWEKGKFENAPNF